MLSFILFDFCIILFHFYYFLLFLVSQVFWKMEYFEVSVFSRFCSDFEVLERLGKGGFGVVYMAKNRLDDNIYAVKKIDLPKRY